MAKNKRWGKKIVDKRLWEIVNEMYVVRGEFLFDLDFVKSWDNELENMNKSKRGAPFQFPESFIEWLAVLSQWISNRGLQGVTRRFQQYGLIPKEADYSTISIRVNKIDTSFELPKEGHISVSTDGSGMKMTNRGDYKETKYGDGKKKFLKVTISADPYKKKLLDIDVSVDGEGDSEPQVAMSHLEALIEAGFDVDKFFGDGAFDVHDLFDLLDQYAILSGIKIRKNASLDPEGKGSWRRKQEILKYRKKGYKRWARENEYGRRWTGTEGIFSALKRISGEGTRSKSINNMLHEVKRKFWAYDQMCTYANA
jgi:hypothetical protein